jgi:hypothetical protein
MWPLGIQAPSPPLGERAGVRWGYVLNARYATQTKKATVMTMKIQNAMPSARVIILSSREHYPEYVESKFAEQKNQIQHRQRQ